MRETLLCVITIALARGLVGQTPPATSGHDSTKASDSTPQNSSYVTVSVIKSIAGERPENEFFELRFKFNYVRRFFGLATLDVALSSRGTDTVSSEQRKLTDAGASLNWGVPADDAGKRVLFIGALAKVFNTIPYYGIVVGSTELNHSAFRGSSTMFSVVRRFYADTAIATYNIFVEIFLHSTQVDFFKRLNIRGGVLLPLRNRGLLQSRILIEVPIVDFAEF